MIHTFRKGPTSLTYKKLLDYLLLNPIPRGVTLRTTVARRHKDPVRSWINIDVQQRQ
jgi:hypothetical protein